MTESRHADDMALLGAAALLRSLTMRGLDDRAAYLRAATRLARPHVALCLAELLDLATVGNVTPAELRSVLVSFAEQYLKPRDLTAAPRRDRRR